MVIPLAHLPVPDVPWPIGAVLARVRAQRRSRSWIGLALVIGLGAGSVLAAVAGARRTETAYARFRAASAAADVRVFRYLALEGFYADLDLDQVERLPEVAGAGRIRAFGQSDPEIVAVATTDDRYQNAVDRPKVLDGRLPRPDRLEEIAVEFTLAQSRGLRVGSAMELTFLALANLERGAPITMQFRIVGVLATAAWFPPHSGIETEIVHLSESFMETDAARLAAFTDMSEVRLKRGAADVPAFTNRLREMAGDKTLSVNVLLNQARNVQNSFHLQAVAVWVTAGFLGLVVALILAQLLVRQSAVAARHGRDLSALGMTQGQLWAVGMLHAAVSALAGAAVALIVALLLSPLLPLGVARVAEPDPGIAIDGLVLALGTVGTFVALIVLAVFPTWRSARDASLLRPARGLAVMNRGAAPRRPPVLPSTAMVGVRMVRRRGGVGASAGPLSSVGAVAVGLTALGVAVTFVASLAHIRQTPRLYGWNWDVYLGTYEDFGVSRVVPDLERDPRVSAVGNVGSFPINLANRIEASTFSLGTVKGTIEPTVVEGRPPREPDEIALGRTTLRALGARIGDMVDVRMGGLEAAVTVPKRIVGRVVVPVTGDDERFGRGAVMTFEGEKSLVPPDYNLTRHLAVARFLPGVDVPGLVDELRQRLGFSFLVTDEPSSADLENFAEVEHLPFLLAGLLATLAAATLAHTLLSAVRGRRRDLAILKSLGFTAGQVRRVVAWQASTLTVVAVAVGLPVGVALGRWSWHVFAEHLGTVPEAIAPVNAFLLIVPVALLLANLVAAGPAFLAGRTRPAAVLRAE